MSLKHIIGLMLTIALCAGFASADQQGDLPIAGDTTPQLRMVEGGLCQDVPDDSGSPYTLDNGNGGVVWCLGPDGVTDDLRGCVVIFYDSDWNVIREEEVDPGQYSMEAPENTAFWERYNCHVVDYSCTNFVSDGCGENGDYAVCPDNQMLRVRDCSDSAPDSVETERCIPWKECYNPECQYTVSDWGPCTNGYRERTVTDSDCETRTETESCTVGCSSPSGAAGDTYCSETNLKYYCNGQNGAWQRIGSCETGESGGSSSDLSTAKSVVAESWTTYWDPTNRQVTGKVKLKNTGDDMTDTHILEMQVRPEGESALAFISGQKTCDPEHPENVHKQFMLDAGETAVVELNVPIDYLPNGIGKYEVYFLTRHTCYNQLTDEQLENYDSYQVVPPFKGAEHAGTVTVGNSLIAEAKESMFMMLLPFILMIGGIVVFMYVNPYVGGTAFVAGVISWVIPMVM